MAHLGADFEKQARRSSSQNPWLNQLARLKLPATEGLEDIAASL